uniref:Limiting CO2-inducible protein B/C beta carbonyic anhydrase domain-containing protein n=1 Tax=Amphora coffeiformis TaxID=265554 RepID=A0A7S3PD27_9STRA|mmetsp:Transcript_10147/g.19535  ORF Transcript_10147/g.19535 Transcript_10147/m.19535 type:complete len:314 (+) Transcript_10147:118-1059(+)|eukprot:scaffold6611_cov150-Amphora_coffeaeformis.AAC.1
MVAVLHNLHPLLALLASRSPKPRGALPAEALESMGRLEYFKPSEPLRMSPQDKKLSDEFFPGSLTGEEVFLKTMKTLDILGFDEDNTLVACSICPDEINNKKGDIADLFHGHFGRVFHLGGLGGIPFTGKTGFSAFSNHVRDDDGNCLVLMAPHIGLSTAKLLGMYSKTPNKDRTACGAAIGALNYCLSGKELPPFDSEEVFDYQEDYIIRQIKKHQAEIVAPKSDNAIQATLAHHMWKIAKGKLDDIVNTNFGGPRSKLLVLTGVMINLPHPHGDLFQPLTFELHFKDGTMLNVFDETFGQYKPRPSSKLRP